MSENMVIETLEKKYTVIRYLFSDRQVERYICRDESDGKYYMVIRIKEKEWIVGIMDFLMQQMENTDFTDLSACFFKEECLFIAMRYNEGTTLTEKLDDENCTLEERLEIGKKILDHLMIQRMPDYFMKDCLKPGNIMVGAGLEMDFQYGLQEIADYYKVQFSDVCGRIAELLRLLFTTELEKKTLPEMEAFIKHLQQDKYSNILEIYTAYDELYKTIKEISPEDLMTPRTWPFRAWEKVKRTWPVVKKAVALLLFLAAIAFLIYSIQDSRRQGGEEKSFEYIGTLKIK